MNRINLRQQATKKQRSLALRNTTKQKYRGKFLKLYIQITTGICVAQVERKKKQNNKLKSSAMKISFFPLAVCTKFFIN